MKFIASLDGLYGIHPHAPYGQICFFKSLNDAKTARNLMDSKGIKTGSNICRFEICPDGVPEFKEVCE